MRIFSGEELNKVYVEATDKSKCEEVSEVSPNTICTQAKSRGLSDCVVSLAV